MAKQNKMRAHMRVRAIYTPIYFNQLEIYAERHTG